MFINGHKIGAKVESMQQVADLAAESMALTPGSNRRAVSLRLNSEEFESVVGKPFVSDLFFGKSTLIDLNEALAREIGGITKTTVTASSGILSGPKQGENPTVLTTVVEDLAVPHSLRRC